MIGHYLLTLTPEQEDRVLTGKMQPGSYSHGLGHEHCLVGCVWGGVPSSVSEHAAEWGPGTYWPPLRLRFGDFTTAQLDAARANSVEARYDDLCDRVGTSRANDMIRERILANRIRRELRGISHMVVAARQVAV